MKNGACIFILLLFSAPITALSGTILPDIDKYYVGDVIGFGLNPYSKHNNFCHDFNGDGICDLAFEMRCVEGDTAVQLLILHGNPNGNFQTSIEVSIPLSSPCEIGIPIAMDFDGDGLDDFVAPQGNGDLLVAVNNGNGSWPAISYQGLSHITWASVYIRSTLAAFDCNGDGIDELVATDGYTFWVLKFMHSIVFVSTLSIETLGWGFTCAGIADFNGDGFEDLMEGHEYAGINILGNDGACGFHWIGGAGHWGPVAVIGNFNGDSYDDFIYWGDEYMFRFSGVWYAEVLFGDSTSFRSGPEIDLYAPPYQDLSAPQVLAADLNGDGMDDIGIVKKQEESGLNPIFLRYSEGETFSAIDDTLMLPVSYGTLGSCYAVFAEELNGDGYDDLLYMCAPDTLAVIISQPPVATELQTFESRYDTNLGVILKWKVSITENNAVFILSRSTSNRRIGTESSSPVKIGEVRASSLKYDYVFTDTEARNLSGESVTYFLSVEEEGKGTRSLGELQQTVPTMNTVLYQNYPNPFNPSTTIDFVIPNAGTASIIIYDVSGRLVRRLLDKDLEAGRHSVSWDGHNDSGIPVSSGIYYYCLKTGKTKMTREMVLMR